MTYSFIDDGHVSSPAGFRATGVAAGLKEVRSRDLALIYSQRPCVTAAIFTTNAVVAASVYLSQAVLARNADGIRAVLANAGCANAATGQPGLTAAIECAKIVADELEVPRDSVLLLSSGTVGSSLPVEKMRDGIRRAASELDSSGGRRAALAMLNSEGKPKERAARVSLGDGRSAVVAGLARAGRPTHMRAGARQAILTTDAPIASGLLTRALEQSYNRSFGRLAIDDEPSSNDTFVLLANGAVGGELIDSPSSPAYAAWQAALDAVCDDLALQTIRDAASGGKVLTITVRGALSEPDAQQIARAIARSRAVRWACSRAATDWSGILTAVGASASDLRANLLEIRIGSQTVLSEGVASRAESAALIQILSGPEIELLVDLHIGNVSASVWTALPDSTI